MRRKMDIGVDGWPTDKRHPVFRADATHDQAAFVARELRRYQRAYGDGSLPGSWPALAEAVVLCAQFGLALPAWATAVVLVLLRERFHKAPKGAGKKGGRHSKPSTAHNDFMKHFARWDAVIELQERREDDPEFRARLRQNRETTFSAVSRILEATDPTATVGNVEKSFDLVKNLLRTGKGMQFFVPGYRNPLTR